MKNIIIFGASNGGKALLKNLLKRNDCTVTAFLDNDISKKDTLIDNVKVYPPEELKNLLFDEIHIGSQFVEEIKNKILSFGVKEEKIFIPPKYMFADNILPFKDEKIKAQAERIIIEITEFLRKESIRHSISYGTLLGIYRDKGIIPWDTDVDIAIFELIHKEKIHRIQTHLKTLFPSLSPWNSYMLLNQKDASICRGYKIKNKKFHIDLGYTVKQDDFWNDFISKIPCCYFDQLKTFSFRQSQLSVPFDTEGYLTYLYGKDWNIPKEQNSFEDNNYSMSSTDGFFKKYAITN